MSQTGNEERWGKITAAWARVTQRIPDRSICALSFSAWVTPPKDILVIGAPPHYGLLTRRDRALVHVDIQCDVPLHRLGLFPARPTLIQNGCGPGSVQEPVRTKTTAFLLLVHRDNLSDPATGCPLQELRSPWCKSPRFERTASTRSVVANPPADRYATPDNRQLLPIVES